ncbi:MAG: two-component system cell cycle response regulator [Pseudomonas sp.]
MGNTVATASISVTIMLSADISYQDTLKRADLALYEAKGLGKDRVISV